MKIIELLCTYLKPSNWNEDGSPSNDDSYYLIATIKTNKTISQLQNELETFDTILELDTSEEIQKLFASDDYVEDTLEVIQILSYAGHPIS